MIKLIAKQFSRHPIGCPFLMLGYIISLLIISIGTTSIAHMRQLALERTEGMPKNALTISASIDKNINFNQYIQLFLDIKKDSNIIFLGMRSYIDQSKKDEIYNVTCEFFTRDPDWTYPILKGRYYTPNEIQLGMKVVLIGKELDKYTVNVDNKKIIKISGEDYEVVGLIGRNRKETPWDTRIFMPITSIPESSKRDLLGSRSINCIIHNSNTSTMEDYNLIKNNILKIDNKAVISVGELSNRSDVIANSLGSNETLILFSALIFIVSLINSINITSYWINDRKKEIGIMKAFGHTDFNIIYMLIAEMIGINLISCMISLLFQGILGFFTDKVASFSIEMSIENFLVGVIMVIISSLITSIIPIYRSLKIQPIEALKI